MSHPMTLLGLPPAPDPLSNFLGPFAFHSLLIMSDKEDEKTATTMETTKGRAGETKVETEGAAAETRPPRRNEAVLHEFAESEGYVLEDSGEEGGAGAGVKLAKDGHTRLIPQPSDDPNDPLNWSWRKKHLMLVIVSLTALLPDYGSATGAVTLQVQAE
jgi:hypothetical protein